MIQSNYMAKKMTIENLAGMVQGGFQDVGDQVADIRNTMATKEELRETREVLAQAIKDLDSRLFRNKE